MFLFLVCVLAPVESANVCKGPESTEKVSVPGVTMGMRGAGTASATRAPWVNSNGARFLLKPNVKYLYDVPKGKGALAAAEALVFGADAQLRIAPEDAKAVNETIAAFKPEKLAAAANIAVVDNGSKTLPEVVNLLVRRNLLCRIVAAPDTKADLNVTIGSPEFPEAEAANPVAVADKARQMLTDRKRLIRIYGSEVVIGRLFTGGGKARLHLLNYGSGAAPGIRVRVRGPYKKVQGTQLEEVTAAPGAIEFTVPEMGAYAVFELE